MKNIKNENTNIALKHIDIRPACKCKEKKVAILKRRTKITNLFSQS